MVQHDGRAVYCACEESSGRRVVEISRGGGWLVGIVCEKVVGVLWDSTFWLREIEKERETYKKGIHPCVDLLHPVGEVVLFRLKSVGKFRLTDRG